MSAVDLGASPSVLAPAPTSPSGRRVRDRRSLGAGASLGLGISMVWFSLLVLIPLTAVLISAAGLGLGGFWSVVTADQTLAALRLTVLQSLAVTAVNVVMGTALAWVLVRDRFWGKRLLDIVIDVPFALPTIVAGLVLLSLYGPQSPLGVNAANTRLRRSADQRTGEEVVTHLKGNARSLPCRGHWDFDPTGPLAWLTGRRPLASFRMRDFAMSFG